MEYPRKQKGRLLRLLRDIQQHPDAHQGHEQRRPSIGNKRQRNPLGRHQPQHDADVDESLQDDHGGDSDGEKASEAILSAQRRTSSAPEENRKQDDDRKRSHQPQLFGGDGKNEIRVRLGKIKQFLLPFHQAEPGHAASRNGNERLNNVEAKSLRIGVRIQEGQDAVFSVRHVKDQEIERQQRGRERVSKIAQPDSSDEQDANRNARASDGGAEVRLKNNQPKKNCGGRDGGDQRIAPIAHDHRLGFVFEKQ